MAIRAFALAGVLLLVWHGAGAAAFTVAKIGTLPGATGSVATAINSSGAVAGYSRFPGDLAEQAFVLTNGTLQPLGTFPNGHYSVVFGINASGHLAGDSDAGDYEPRGFLRESGPLLDLETTGGAQIHAMAVNDAGLVAGYMTKSGSGNPANFRAVIWRQDPTRPGRFERTILPVLTNTTDATLTFSLANAINASGQVAGSCYVFPSGERGVIWLADDPRTVVDLGTLPGGTDSFAEGLNDAGMAVGWSYTPSQGDRAVLWSNDPPRTALSLGTLPGHTNSQAHAINSAGAVVGTSWGPEGPRAFLWQQGVMHDLNALLAKTAPGWELRSAHALNDSGWIVGAGAHNGSEHGFVLAPVAPPLLSQPRLISPAVFQLTISAETNRVHLIQISPDLTHWTDLRWITNPPASLTVELPAGTAETGSYYRAVTP